MQGHHAVMWWLGSLSLLTFVATLILVPVLVVGMPPDYFDGETRAEHRPRFRHPALRLIALVGKNVLGAVLFVTGLLMVFIPGQGLLTMFIGVTLIDFPGKFRFERRMVRRPAVLQSVNWLRSRYGREELHCV